MPVNKVHALGVPTFNASIVFTCFEKMPGNKLDSHSTFPLCLTRFERMPGSKVDSLGVPTFNVPIIFYLL